MGSQWKLGFGIVVLVLLCVGAAIWQLGPVEQAPPPGEGPGEGMADRPGDGLPPPAPDQIDPAPAPEPETAGKPDAERPPNAGEPKFTPRMWRVGPVETVRGSVEQSGSGKPLQGIEVLLEPDVPTGDETTANEAVRVLTDENGSFSFERLTPGRYRVTILHPDYAHLTRRGVRIDEQGGIEGIVFSLSDDPDTFGAIEGTVVSPDRTSLPGARVVVHSQEPSVRVETVTDEGGFYRVERLLAGYYHVSLLGSPEAAQKPDAPDRGELWRRFILTTVRPRETTRVDFAGTGTLTGVVVDHDDRPLSGITVQLVPVEKAEGYKVREGASAEDGTFRIENAGLGPQEVWLQSKKEGWTVRAETLSLTGNDLETRFRMENGVVQGRITLAEEKVPPASKRLYPGVLLHASDLEKEGEFGPHRAIVYPDFKGNFRLPGLTPGKYRLKIFLNGYVTEKRDVEVVWGGEPTPLEFALRKLRIGTLKLTVKDAAGKPIDGLNLGYGTPARGFRTARAEKPEPGVYLARTVEVGTWKLYVSREDLKTGSAEFQITEGGTTEVSMTMEVK